MNEWRHSEVRSGAVIRPVRYKVCARRYSMNFCLFIRVILPHREKEKQIKFLFVSNFPEYAQAHRGVHLAFGRIR